MNVLPIDLQLEIASYMYLHEAYAVWGVLVRLRKRWPNIDICCCRPGVVYSEAYLRELRDACEWYTVCVDQKLSEPFMREHADRLEWYPVSDSQDLSEAFMHDFADRLDWRLLCREQQMSEQFMREHIDRLDWPSVKEYQRMSVPFREEHSRFYFDLLYYSDDEAYW